MLPECLVAVDISVLSFRADPSIKSYVTLFMRQKGMQRHKCPLESCQERAAVLDLGWLTGSLFLIYFHRDPECSLFMLKNT